MVSAILDGVLGELSPRTRSESERSSARFFAVAAGLAIHVEHLDRAGIEQKVRAHIEHWRTLLRRHVQDGRQVLRERSQDRSGSRLKVERIALKEK